MQFRINRRIRNLAVRRSVSFESIADELGVPYREFVKIIQRKRSVYAYELEPIAKALGVTREDLFKYTADDCLSELEDAVTDYQKQKRKTERRFNKSQEESL